ncbi:MAG: cytochrome P450, partial [Sphingomonadales bacterium]
MMGEHEVSTYDACVHALKQPDLRQSLYDAAALMMSDVLVNLHGQEHRARRLVEGTIFRKDVFLHYEKNFLPRTLDETIRPFLEAGKGDLVDIGYRVMMNLTVDFAGIDRPERTAEETGELLRLLKEFSLAPALGQSLEEDIEPKKARIRKAMGEFEEQFLKPSRNRREALLADVEA